jgi:5-methylcytosine-specific restriction endonuclease McrA
MRATPQDRNDADAIGYKVQFVAGRQLMEALEQVRRVLSLRVPERDSMEAILTIVVEEYLARHCPQRRQARRGKKRAKRVKTKPAQQGQQTSHENSAGGPATPTCRSGKRAAGCSDPRRIPVAVRDRVLAGAQYQCSYVGSDGVRCCETRGLQIDHIRPVSLGGGNDPGNLRVLCPAHNILEAERLLGAATMAPYTGRWRDGPKT